MSEKMLVTQALDERDLLVKKIADKIAKASFVDTIKPNEDKVFAKRTSKEEYAKEAESAYQQITDLIDRFQSVYLERKVDEAHHSTKLDEEEVKQKLAEYFKTHSFLQRRDFERLTGFNSSKSTRVIRELVKEGVLKNAGTKYQPVYVRGELNHYN